MNQVRLELLGLRMFQMLKKPFCLLIVLCVLSSRKQLAAHLWALQAFQKKFFKMSAKHLMRPYVDIGKREPNPGF